MKTWIGPLLGGVWSLAGCAGQQLAEDAAAGSQDFDRTPRDCITTTRISRTEVLDEQTILFHMNGREIYRNVLADVCRGLDSRDAFAYRQRGVSSRLCAGDSIDVLEHFGGGYERGRACLLGSFYPMTSEELADIKRTGPSAIEVTPVDPEDEATGTRDEPAGTGEEATSTRDEAAGTRDEAAGTRDEPAAHDE